MGKTLKTQIRIDDIELVIKVGTIHKINGVNALVHCSSLMIKVNHGFKDITNLLNLGMGIQLLDKVFEVDNFEVQTNEWDLDNCQELEVEFISNEMSDGWHDLINVTLAGHDFKPYMSDRAEDCIMDRLDKYVDELNR